MLVIGKMLVYNIDDYNDYFERGLRYFYYNFLDVLEVIWLVLEKN